MSAAPPAVLARGLVRSFGSTVAVDGVDLDVAAGEVRGLLGPNGAGKTTLLRMLFGLLGPDTGTIGLLGRTPTHAVGSVDLDGVAGFVEDPCFYPYLTGRANLEVLAELDGGANVATVDDVLERVGLRARARDRVSGYSTGMRQRLGIAASLLRRPRLLLLDEPTSGLDPEGARAVAALVRELSAEGVAVLLSSHQISEVEEICDSFTVLRDGRVVWDGTATDLRHRAPTPSLRMATSDDRRALDVARRHPGLGVAPHADGGLEVAAAVELLDAFVLDLGRDGVAVRRMDRQVSPLAAMFFALTGPGSAPTTNPAPTPGPTPAPSPTPTSSPPPAAEPVGLDPGVRR